MKTKALVGIGLTLLLLNALNIVFVITPVIAYVDMKEAYSEKLKEYESDASKDSLQFDGKFSEKTSSTYSAEDGWNFNYTNHWNEFAYVDGDTTRLVVGLSNANPEGYNSLKKLTIQNSGKIVNSVSIKGKVAAVIVEIPLNVMSSFVTDVRAAGLASYIEPNMKFQMNIVPNDPYWSWQWGPQKIEADWAWNTTIGDPSVLVAVVDTGIDWDHPDLAANYVSLGYDWVNNDYNPMDDHGHGTHCAGIIAAVINNGIGIAGLAQVQIMAEKGLDAGGSGYEDWLANAIIHAVDQGADIISMSWGGYFHSELIYEAIKYAYDSGVLLVAAAGNDGISTKMFPAGYDEVIAVAATNQYDGQPWWTNYGDWIELAAPGVDIYSTVWNNGYAYMSGTSMACPHVAGLAALVWSRFPGKARDWVRLWLRFTADDLGDPGFDIRYGYGRINARKAVEQGALEHELIILSWETPSYVKPSFSGIINATILNFGENDENNIEVQLLANDTIADSKFIDSIGSGALVTVSCLWSPTIEGLYNITIYVVPVPDETIVENNMVSKYIYVGFPVKAVVLDSAGTDIGEVIATWQVLNINWHLFGSTLIYIDYTTLNKENISYEDLVATEADVLIISCASDPWAGWQFTDSEIEAIKRYVYEGHGLIATAGTFYYYVPNNNKLASLFGLSESMICYATGTDLLHIQEPTHPLFLKVPNPLVFSQVGTAVPSDGLWDANELVDGKYLALGHYKESAIVVRRGLVYISPLLEIIPAYYHHHLQLLYNAIIWSRY
ncbi:MAG: S8 family serine peptidase, partial [Candidatus Bathyarchaeota archaeon]|nr:S8 family serine peptidase [Candidatus Bathyarchaeota archaeon]